MATSYHVTLPEIETLGYMREEVSLRNVEEPTTAPTALETRVSIVGTFNVSTATKSHLRAGRIPYFVFAGFLCRHCIASVLEVRKIPMLALVLAILTLLPLQRWVDLETRGSGMILHVTARIIIFNYNLTL
jgi:hypothetical protein